MFVLNIREPIIVCFGNFPFFKLSIFQILKIFSQIVFPIRPIWFLIEFRNLHSGFVLIFSLSSLTIIKVVFFFSNNLINAVINFQFSRNIFIFKFITFFQLFGASCLFCGLICSLNLFIHFFLNATRFVVFISFHEYLLRFSECFLCRSSFLFEIYSI